MRVLSIVSVFLLCGSTLPAADPAPPFKDKIAPLLTARCLRCHKSKESAGSLDLTTREGFLKGGKKGPAIVPGKSAESLLYDKVAKKQMPFRSKPLTDDEMKLLKKWIDSGAAWEGPALVPPKQTGPLPPSRKGNAPPQSAPNRAGADWWSFQPIARSPHPKPSALSEWNADGTDDTDLHRLDHGREGAKGKPCRMVAFNSSLLCPRLIRAHPWYPRDRRSVREHRGQRPGSYFVSSPSGCGLSSASPSHSFTIRSIPPVISVAPSC